MKKGIFTIAFIPLFFILIPVVHAENSKQVYQVGTNNLNVREAPNHDANIVGQVQKGDRITAFQEKHGWVQTYYAGKVAWVASQYLYKDQADSETPETVVTNTITITKDAVHLRGGPGTSHMILGFAAAGDTFTLIDSADNWLQVDLGNGKTGWVASWLTDQSTTTDDAPVSDVAETTNDTSTTEDTAAESAASETPQSSENVSNKSLAGYNIMLDPGHGGIDPGAIGLNGEHEKDLALQFTRTIAEKLRNEGATVLLTRSTNEFVSLEERMRINDAYMIDAFISFHFNASTSPDGNGVSSHYYENGQDKYLAESLQAALTKYTNFNNRGVRQNNYHVLRENSTVSTLVELGFLTNAYDLRTIKQSESPVNVAGAIAEGLKHYFH
ncbi:MAG TPA: N-acetylmuramoyl-L-alanine amidase [Bacillota bacterium]|nr:N-acetylmuramoyl-L-alanine amidase [Bacillota bacterium]